MEKLLKAAREGDTDELKRIISNVEEDEIVDFVNNAQLQIFAHYTLPPKVVILIYANCFFNMVLILILQIQMKGPLYILLR